jgi:hypothetical protein
MTNELVNVVADQAMNWPAAFSGCFDSLCLLVLLCFVFWTISNIDE